MTLLNVYPKHKNNMFQFFCYNLWICTQSNSNKSFIECLQRLIEALYFAIRCARKVMFIKKLPSNTVSNEKLKGYFERMKNTLEKLAALTPSRMIFFILMVCF